MDTPHPLSAAALFDLKNWVAVVTGGGTGVGLMIAQVLAANGAKVYITGRRADVLETSARVHGSKDKLGENGGEILALTMDVTDKESIKKAVSEITEKEGHVNVLVNNAGVWKNRPAATPAKGPEEFGAAIFNEEMDDTWQESFRTNATSPYFVTGAFLPLLAKAASSPVKQVGTVINNASIAGLLRMTQRHQYSYNVSKAAAIHLTRQMALDLSHEDINIRVNGIALGYFPSEMTTSSSNDENTSEYDVQMFRTFMNWMGVKCVKRMGSARDLASVILTLVTNEYIWGTISILDGGIALNLPGNM
ncbi:NAD(P)-binding protein [Astrocystis sublimbata]|nr:NAD(P)-binding protein [Astrocystis sublimbata]